MIKREIIRENYDDSDDEYLYADINDKKREIKIAAGKVPEIQNKGEKAAADKTPAGVD
jgi:hypothetical protein